MRLNHFFQGVKNHRLVHPLSTPGSTDLSANVDFFEFSKAVLHLGSQN